MIDYGGWDMTSSPSRPPTNFFEEPPRPWEPHKVQLQAVKFLLEHDRAGLFADPGVGKTSVVMSAVKILKAKGLLRRALVVVPRRPLHLVWPKEIVKWENFHGLKMEILHGDHKDQATDASDLYLVTPDGLDWLARAERWRTPVAGRVRATVDVKRFRKLGFDTLIIDELTRFKTASSGRSRVLQELLPTFKRRWGLTGDPSPNGLIDLFGQMYVLDLGKALGRYVTHYRHEFFDQNPYGYGYTLKEGAKEKIYARVAPVVMRISDAHLDVPEEVHVRVDVELPAKARRVYDELEAFLVARLEGKVQGKGQTVTAANAGVASMKCRQICAGSLYLDREVDAETGLVRKLVGPRPYVELHDEKLDALADHLESLQGQPLLVAYEFEHEAERLRARFVKTYGVDGELPIISGKTSDRRAAKLERMWNDGELPFLGGQWQALAWGLNLQRAARHVWAHSLTWDYEPYNQLIRRVRRQGNTAKRVFVHHPLAVDTVDVVQYHVLRAKRHDQQAFFDALQDLARRRRAR